ncbi:uncharacterized protein LOC111691585 [Anoplophora glabripennis]|uniref:uncharacterized protein LOC111691585 n=1 Tax=Anoplophora glabripennis TaxID=217634 RepID=UPI000C79054B|nr:uncharacterized protein LOC111691585 [Anoplophora glabripennis]
MAIKKRKKPKMKPKPVIEYPPVPTKKWIPPDQRAKKKRPPHPYTKPAGVTQKLAISSLKKVWNQFNVYGNTAVLTGHYSQTYKKYSFKTNGYQGACNCAVACTFAYIYKMHTWTCYCLDKILDLGDELYTKSTQQEAGRCLTLVPPEQVFNSFYLDRTKVLLNINVGPKVVETLPTVTEQKVKELFKKSLTEFFKQYPSGIFALREKYLAIWLQDDAFYVFDPTDHDEYGRAWTGVPGDGVAVLLRTKTMDDMVQDICNNVNTKIPHTKYEIIQCTVSRITNIKTMPPKTFEEFMEKEEAETAPEIPEVDPEAVKPIDVVKERIKAYMEKNKEDTSSLKVKVEEISPDVTEKLSLSKRPSWLQDTINKNDECMFPIPCKPKLDKISFYVEVLPERVFILKGTTCQTDPKFSKYEGRQSMGNAISALIMLRFCKSRTWVPRLVNTILKYGDLLYRDAMISIPRTQSLKLSDFQRKTEYEKKFFSPLIQDYVIVGKLQSPDYDVLDLLPALENYLIDHECCVVLGPITLAVWVEDGFYYWFDPNERDKNGKTITQCVPAPGQLDVKTPPPGTACVIKFCNLQDLVELYLNNVNKPQKFDPFYISSVQIDDYFEIPESWYGFKGLIPGKWILRGTITQSSKTFPKESRNYQGPAMSIAALLYQYLVPEKDWTANIVDEILGIGDQLYKESVERLKNSEKFVSKLLTISEVNPDLKVRGKIANFEIGECCINGLINAKHHPSVKGLTRGLVQFFEDNDLGVVTSHNISVAVWKKDGLHYSFDSHSRNDKGLATSYGTACALRIQDVDELARSLEINLSAGKEDFYNISWVKVKLCEVQDGVIRPPLNNYTKVGDGSAILRSLYSEISTKYDINCRKQTVPMELMALAFNKLKPSKEWTNADMDEILNKGDDFYTEIMNDILKEELKSGAEAGEEEEMAVSGTEGTEGSEGKGKNTATSEGEMPEEDQEIADKSPEEDGVVDTTNVNKEFYVGLNKMAVEFENVAEGNIKESLKDALTSHFEQEQTDDNFNQEAMIESKPLTVVVWRDDVAFYYFDPKPRDKGGKVIGAEDWSDYEPPKNQEEKEEGTQGEQEGKEGEEEEAEQKEFGAELDTDDDEEDAKREEGGGDSGQVKEQDEKPKSKLHMRLLEGEDEGGEDEEEKGKDKEEGEKKGEGEGTEDKEEKEVVAKLPPVRKSSAFWKEQEKNGRACTMWFTKLEDLVGHVLGNICPKDTYENDFSLRSVKIVNNVVLKNRLKPEDQRNDVYGGSWYDFQELDHGRWIMRGSMNLMNEMFPEENRGKQQVTASYVAVAIAYVFSMLCFDKYSVDTILTYGDKLYTFMKRMRKKLLKKIPDTKLKEDDIDWLVQNEEYDLRDIVRKLCFWKFYVDINVESDYLTGDVYSEVDDVLDVERALEEFFSKNQYGLMQCKDLTVAIWRGQKVYYMFDGMNRGPNGIKSPNGTACITRYLDLEDMTKVFVANLPAFGKNFFVIHNITMTKDLCPRTREAKELRTNPQQKSVESGGFRNVVAGKCIVRGNFSVVDPKFNVSPFLLSAPIAVIALTMSLVHKPNTWSRPMVDDILQLGVELSEESIHDLGYEFNPWEDFLDISRIKNDYSIGVLKANCEFRSRDQKGIIDGKDKYSINLRQENQDIIKKEIQHLMPDNTKKSKISIWKQFLEFCNEKSYNIQEKLPVEELASILEDYSFNMRKKNSEEYKESVVKVMWNSTAKQLQEMYYEEFKVKFDPFSDITFKNARAARDAKRRKLQKDPTKRKLSALALSDAEYMKIVELWDEDCPEGLQRKFFHIASHELAWRGGEGAVANIEYFVEETDNFGKFTGRIEYNPIFSKTTQGGSRKLADSKWLITNINNPTICPVRLFRKMMEKRGIEQFFEENTHGILTTANLTLAIWEEEEDHSEALIYMFDPNPRGPTGMPLDTGTACVMTFVNAKVAADHIMACMLDPDEKMGEFTIAPVEIVVGNMKTKEKIKKTATSEKGVLPRCSKSVADEEKRVLRKIAANERKRKQGKELQKIGRNGYYIMKNGDAIIRGYKSQNSKNYNENSRNNQDITNCIVSIVMHKLIPIDTWTSKHIDLVLDTGDQLYIDSYIAYSPKDKKLGLENVVRKFFLNNIEIHVTVYKPIISDIFNMSNLIRILNVYFQQESYCMLSYLDQWVSIFTRTGFFYLFDPHERDVEGNPLKQKEEGTAVVVRFDNLISLTLKMVQNMYLDLETTVKEFSLWLISVESK